MVVPRVSRGAGHELSSRCGGFGGWGARDKQIERRGSTEILARQTFPASMKLRTTPQHITPPNYHFLIHRPITSNFANPSQQTTQPAIMLIPITAAIAATLRNALDPSVSALSMALGTTEQYFFDMDNISHQAKELGEFMSKQAPMFFNTEATIDGTASPAVKKNTKMRPPPLPNTDDPLTLLGFDRLFPPTWEQTRRRYKEMVKLYHPDVVVAPDATAEERKAASWDFARINSAFDILKRRDEEEVIEYNVYVDGDKVTQRVDVSEEGQRNDPYRINYDRIREVTQYRQRNPRKKVCHNFCCGTSEKSPPLLCALLTQISRTLSFTGVV